MDQAVYDTIIIGGGPAGCAAAVYAARKEMKTLLITGSFGGQSVVSSSIENWIGERVISGADLAKKLESHVKAYPQNVEVQEGEKVTSLVAIKSPDPARYHFEVKTDRGSLYSAKSVIICSGARRRNLGIPGEDRFNGRGVSYCSTCDAPLFKNRKVVVVGGGNAAVEAVQDLLPHAAEIYLITSGEKITGDPATFDEIKNSPKLKRTIFQAQVKEIIGEQFVTTLSYLDTQSNQEQKLEVEGVFVEIGSVPNSELVKGWVQMNSHGEIVIDAKHATSSYPGIFAAGDVTDDPYKQNNISAGDGVKAALAAYNYLLNRSKVTPASG